ncbi:MAG TPA: M4 family metallopeptidase [Actinophytocola sp.]|uniref:M4 family metallopeptidase n=1 Tax=Actinophytocola sp. TaxID=1872138 RepID=UPI002DB8BE69|nr:M4 family metallopeptidase [Actinophytocola sp.]HEU5472632.1 M4 family metallopeptidase [Actinophytocola sp.]
MICFILPQVVLLEAAERGDAEARRTAMNTIEMSAGLRSRRTALTDVVRLLGVDVAGLRGLNPTAEERKTVYDLAGSEDLPGTRARGEGDDPVADVAVNQAFDHADRTHDFYRDVLRRESVDGIGMELVSSVHFGTAFDNAFWNGSQMVYGDGSGRFLAVGSLTKDIAVVAHEITHGVVQFTAGLRYRKQSGALNESFADVLGAVVKQFVAGETADQADWLIGEGILGSEIRGEALRSMKAPGTAFEHDSQPAHMNDFKDLPDDGNPRNDHGGVHINSGIPNKAFYLAATKLGGHSWEHAGPIWYHALVNGLGPDSQFVDAANATIDSAVALYGKGHETETAVRRAWEEVGVL